MYPKAYIEFLAHFHGTRDYFECHEVLEDHWKNVDPKNRHSVWVFLIQIAVSMYHDRRGNQKGAKTLIDRCLRNAPIHEQRLHELGIDPEALLVELKNHEKRISLRESYRSWNFPIVAPDLRHQVEQLCFQWNVSYGLPSDLDDLDLILKHQRRRS